jgi:hypothetical protein
MASVNENAAEQERVEETVSPEKTGSILPCVSTAAALFMSFSFQTLQLVVERSNLASVKASQEAPIQEAQKIQSQFKILITRTSELADKGHAGAKLVMEGLQSQGLGFASDRSAAPGKTEVKPAK